jgi:hypothetical protein
MEYYTFTPEPANCDDKWCKNSHNSIPVNGLNPEVSKCGDISSMLYQQMTTGGLSGRGVTPCPFGYMSQKEPIRGTGAYKTVLTPISPDNITTFRNVNIMEPERKGYLPPQGNFRTLYQVGYEWRNA